MRRIGVFLILPVVALLLASCSEDRTTSPPTESSGLTLNTERAAAGIAALAGWTIEAGENVALAGGPPMPSLDDVVFVARQPVVGDIAHYIFEVRFGPGEYEVFGLHRVVREPVPGRPIKTKKGVFLQHGDLKDFTGMFMPGVSSPRQPDDVGLAVQLAQAGLDVWGIDQAWTRVPEGLGDYSFLLDFGLDRCIADLGSGIEIARVVRRMTGNGYRPMALLGYSSGAALGFAFLNEESQLPRGHQKTCAYVPVDYGLETDDENWMQAARSDMAMLDGLIASGENRLANPFVYFGPPALIDPEGPSSLIPGMTNRQAAIALASYSAYPAIAEVTYHFLAGVFGVDGLPVDLQYTQFDNWVDFMMAAPPNETAAFMRDYTMTALPEYEVPWDDHLVDITTPILYVAAAGGAGQYGLHTLDLISSTDATVLTFGFHPPEEALLDFAHIDLFLAEGASSFVWTPVLDWIQSHTP
jgi:hypothetical protein